ncbi:Neurochondrin-domain-containing protein [Nemania sp. NC0429]|nr:Neurochondrin-domain-containing protein [Nemania sp. NC0429]
MESAQIQKIHQLLSAKDDTSRFVGLLLLKTTLDSHASDLQHDQVAGLWNSISPKFLDRLIRTGSQPASEQRKQSRDMLDVAVAVIYTFTKLLNDCAVSPNFYRRIPNLAHAVLYSSGETTQRLVDLMHVLVQQPDGHTAGGATCFAELDVGNWAPLIEIAPQHETVFSIFHWAWVKGSTAAPVDLMRAKIDDALQLFISSFKGCNPTPLLDFITLILNNLDPALRPPNPQWLPHVAGMIHHMASSKQTENDRRAYTHCAAALLAAYPETAPEPLFSDDPKSSKPIAYLFVKIVQVDILSTLHILIPKLNTVEYPSLSGRIAAALDIITAFVGFLIKTADDATVQPHLTPDRILKVQEDLVRTIGDVMEYLRDRWDNFLAGARGIEQAPVSGSSVFEDPITPSATRLIATWLRDDDGEALRTQAAGLVDLFAELYKMSLTSADLVEVRLPILAALEGILQTSDGREAFHESSFMSGCLYPDLRDIITSQGADLTAGDYMRGSAIVQVFNILLEYDGNPRSYPDSTGFLELIAKYDIKPVNAEADILDRSRLDFQTDTLELAIIVFRISSQDTPPALKQRIKSSLKSAVSQIRENWGVLDDEGMIARVTELHLD